MLVKIVLKRKGNNVKDTFLNWLRTPFSQRKIRNHIFSDFTRFSVRLHGSYFFQHRQNAILKERIILF
jgi:hypothetical protein